MSLYWKGGTAGDTTNWSNAGNWADSSGGTGGAGVPDSTTPVIFDNNSNGFNCILTANADCESVISTTGWNKILDLATYTLDCYSTSSFSGTTGSGVTINGTLRVRGDLTINSTITTVTATSGTLDIINSATITLNKAATFLNIIVAYPNKTISWNVGNLLTISCSNVFTINGGNFNFDSPSSSIFLTPSIQTDPLVIVPGSTFKITFSTSSLKIRPTNVAPLAVNIPALTISGSGEFDLQKISTTANLTYNLVGALVVPWIQISNLSSVVSTFTFNTNNYPMTFSGGSNFLNANINVTTVFNMGSSVIMSDLANFGFGGGLKACILNMGTSQWIVTRTWYIGPTITLTYSVGHIVTMTATGTAPYSFTTSNKAMGKVILSADSKTIIFADTSNVNDVSIMPGTTVRFLAGGTFTFGAITWDGTSTKPITLVSSVSGSYWNLVAPANVTSSYVNVTDSNNTGSAIDASNGSNTVSHSPGWTIPYTLASTVNNAELGNPIQIRTSILPSYPSTLRVNIGGNDIQIGATPLDLGNLFTAKQILDSYDFRLLLLKGMILATPGTTSLSK